MNGKLLRRSLFGYKKADVFRYIEMLDAKAEMRVREKENEAAAAKAEVTAVMGELEEARKNRDAIVSVLEIAQKHAKDIIERAQKSAEEIESGARSFAEKEKTNLNREIEIKKRDINNHFITESKKISALRKEVEELRQISLRSIRKFEQDLGNIEAILEQKEELAQKNMAKDENDVQGFFDSVRAVPIRVIKPENPENTQANSEESVKENLVN